jgi:hypothetical protein
MGWVQRDHAGLPCLQRQPRRFTRTAGRTRDDKNHHPVIVLAGCVPVFYMFRNMLIDNGLISLQLKNNSNCWLDF